MIEFKIKDFFDENKKNISSKEFLDSQIKDLNNVKLIINSINSSMLNINDPEKYKESVQKQIFTLDQDIRKSMYMPEYQDFNKNYSFVFSGCSETQGQYISTSRNQKDFDAIWGFKVADNYKQDALNLGVQGASVEGIVKGLMHHFRKNGNPKVLLVLLPDLGRTDFVVNNKILSETKNDLTPRNAVQQYYFHPDHDYDYEKVTKVPHHFYNVMPYTASFYRSLQALLVLDTYCKSSGIFFRYTSWDLVTNFILKSLKDGGLEEYQNYIEGDFFNWSTYCKSNLKLDCHQEYNTGLIKELDLWDYANDKTHMGAHRHIHIAERFIEEIDKNNPWH